MCFLCYFLNFLINQLLAIKRWVRIAPSKAFVFYHKRQYMTRPGAFENTNLESLCKHGQIEARSGGQGDYCHGYRF